VGRTLTNLGVACYSLGDAARAQDLLRRALSVKEKAFGPDHVQVAVTAFNLGLAERVLGDRAAAVASLQRALAIYERQQGAEHPATRQARAALAAVESARGGCVVS
jgi:Tfp pilus assembly protein PilF